MRYFTNKNIVISVVVVIVLVGILSWYLFFTRNVNSNKQTFTGPPKGDNISTTTAGIAPPGFRGPSGPPHVNGPSGPPPSY